MKKIGKQVAFLASSKNNPRNGEGSFLRLKDGRILYAYTDYYGTSWKDEATARISAIYSDDEGETWSAPEVLIEKEEGQLNIMSVSLARMPNGEIGIVYLEKVDAGDRHTYCMPIFRYSSDEGKSFSPPLSLADEYDSYFEAPKYDGKHFIYYTPPRRATGNTVVAINAAKSVAHVAFPIFTAYRKTASPVYKDMIKQILDRFMPDNLIKPCNMPSTSRITLTGCEEYKLLHVKVTYPEMRGKLGVIEEHNVLPEGRAVAVKGEYSHVMRLPDKAPVRSDIKDGYTYITLPAIVGYDMFLLKN